MLERSFTFPGQVLSLMVNEKVTGFPGVPTIFATIASLKSIQQYDLSAIRYVTNTAAALPVKHITMLRELFPQARIFSMYGLTECKRCTYLPPEDIDRKPESVGIAIPNTELWLVDEDGNKLGPNQVGQLVIRGATVMKGYWEKPEATARKIKPGPLPGETVLWTGDYCRLDDEGYLYFVARMDDIIKSRGEKVAPTSCRSSPRPRPARSRRPISASRFRSKRRLSATGSQTDRPPPSGGRCLLANHVGLELRDRVEVLGQHLVVLHLEAELVLEEADQLEHPRRVDDTAVEQRAFVGKRIALGDVEIGLDELPKLGAHQGALE